MSEFRQDASHACLRRLLWWIELQVVDAVQSDLHHHPQVLMLLDEVASSLGLRNT